VNKPWGGGGWGEQGAESYRGVNRHGEPPKGSLGIGFERVLPTGNRIGEAGWEGENPGFFSNVDGGKW